MTPRERLFALEHFGIKLGLDNILTLVEALDRPDRAWTAVHVAGTNGKGSVTAMIERGLREAGHRTGRYTSPHLQHIEERVAIDGQPVDAATFDAAADHVLSVADRLQRSGRLATTPTFFEVTTAIAFEMFRRAHVSVAVVEVGLGGRFDATNVITPKVCVITSIALDHERHLGTTLDQIAFEKAGIIKPQIPLVVADLDESAMTVVDRVASAHGAPIVCAGMTAHLDACDFVKGRAQITLRTPSTFYGRVKLSLSGYHQIGNAIVATRALELCHDAGIDVGRQHVITALTDVEWPARLEWLRVGGDKYVLLDAAHNPAGAHSLHHYLSVADVAPLPIVIATMTDKDVEGMLDELSPVASRFITSEVGSARSLTASALAARIARHVPEVPVEIGGSATDALDLALAYASRVVVAGSIFLVGPTRARLIEGGAVPLQEAP